MTIETLSNIEKFDQKHERYTLPEIDRIYLSSLEEEYLLSMSVLLDTDDKYRYVAHLIDDEDMFVETEVSEEAYRYYAGQSHEKPDMRPHSPEALVADIMQHNDTHGFTVATIAGRSGSGKSTVVAQIKALCEADRDVAVLSTDDYNRGKTWLDAWGGAPWKDWDAPIVYDVEALRQDIAQLRSGAEIHARQFDFASQEPTVTGTIRPAPIILVEGIYAKSPVLQPITHIHHEVPTPLATCIGRRLKRDFAMGRTNESLGDPQTILRYLLEVAEPNYQAS